MEWIKFIKHGDDTSLGVEDESSKKKDQLSH